MTRPDLQHRPTDPMCAQHREPRSWFARLRFDRARGRVCVPCARLRFERAIGARP